MKARTKINGMTLVEIVITMGVTGVVGAILASLLHGVFVLSAKNSAINFSHQQMRETIHKAVDDIRESASVPQLIDANRVPLSTDSAGPAAGVAYQTLTGGPYRVWASTQANSNIIQITSKAGDPAPTPGMRLVIPAFQVEADIAQVGGVQGQSTVRSIQLTSSIGVAITCQGGDPVYQAYYTRRSGFVVANGELRQFPDLAKSSYTVTARNITTPKPFSIPNGNNRFIGMEFVSEDPRSSRRGYKAVDTKLTLNVAYRNTLTTRQ